MTSTKLECPFCHKDPDWYYEGVTVVCKTPGCALEGIVFDVDRWNIRKESLRERYIRKHLED